MASRLVVIVDGTLVADTGHVIGSIRERLTGFQTTVAAMQATLGVLMSELAEALDGFQASLTTLVTEIEELLTAPDPDVLMAVQRLSEMKTLVDTEVQHIRDAEQPPAPTP